MSEITKNDFLGISNNSIFRVGTIERDGIICRYVCRKYNVSWNLYISKVETTTMSSLLNIKNIIKTKKEVLEIFPQFHNIINYYDELS
jgi:hypothetical protein